MTNAALFGLERGSRWGLLRVCRLLLLLMFATLHLSLPRVWAEVVVANGSTWRFFKGTQEASTPLDAWRAAAFDDGEWLEGPAPFHYGEGLVGGTELTDMARTYNTVYLRKQFYSSDPGEISGVVVEATVDDGFALWLNGRLVVRYNCPEDPLTHDSEAMLSNPPREFRATVEQPGEFLQEGLNQVAVMVLNTHLQSSDLLFEMELSTTAPDTKPPVLQAVDPAPGALSALDRITVIFSEPVVGVGTSDLLLNGAPAMSLTGSGDAYTFTFGAADPGRTDLTWAGDASIYDLAIPPNRFDAQALEAQWTYTLVDLQAPAILSMDPPAGAVVAETGSIRILFSETVIGVDAGDLLVNGLAAESVMGLGPGPYLFSFPEPAPGPVTFSWASGHAITDQAEDPNLFEGESWTITLDPDYAPPPLRINEFLASNGGAQGLFDSDGSLQDWIELYNAGDQAVSLAGWSLTDDPDDPRKWVFPARLLEPGAYLLVFASGKDRRPEGPTGELHTSFQLSRYGEYLGLFGPDSWEEPVFAFAPQFPEQRTDLSYGWDSGTQRWGYFSQPTPGALNGSSEIIGILERVHFSVNHGFFDRPFLLHLSSPDPGSEIRYTLDGSEPTRLGGAVYTSAIRVAGNTILRAAAFQDGFLPGEVETRSYLFPEQVLAQGAQPDGFPGSWGGARADYEMDPEILAVADVRAEALEGLREIPSISIVLDVEDMFGSEGIYSNPLRQRPTSPLDQVEKPASVEFIDPSGRLSGIQVNCGLRIQGDASREPDKNPKHSLRLLFKGDYGPSKLEAQLFEDSPVRSLDTLVLRGEFNNSWTHWSGEQRPRGSNLRDQWGRDSQLAMSGYGSHGNSMHVFINGLYWGLYNPSERVDAAFAASYFGGEKEEYDAIRPGGEVRDGTRAAWDQMMSIVRSGPANDARLQELEQILDMDGFIDYMILNIYGANADWPHKNWGAVRRRQPGELFRFICWDIERILEFPGSNMSTVSQYNTPAEIYAWMRSHPEIRMRFADRLQAHFFGDGALTPGAAEERWMSLGRRIAMAVVCESARWGDYRRDVHPYSVGPYTLYTKGDHWLPELQRVAESYLPARGQTVLNQFRSLGLYPDLPTPVFTPSGGRVETPEISVVIRAGEGETFFTTDGSDPRVAWTGAVSASAQLFTGPIPLHTGSILKARTRLGGQWSALSEAVYRFGPDLIPIRWTELMYHPAGPESLEFVEFKNIGPTPVDLTGFRIQGLDYRFPPGTVLEGGAVMLLASGADPNAFLSAYPGVHVYDWYAGALSNAGERIVLLDDHGNRVDAVEYDDAGGWPMEADGDGRSLERLDVMADGDDAAQWQASPTFGGTPGVHTVPAHQEGPIRIAEFMASNRSAVPHDGLYPDWVELENIGTETIELGGWSLSDRGEPGHFTFPAGVGLGSGERLLVWCDQATTLSGLRSGFALDMAGEMLCLFDAAGRRVDIVQFGRQLEDYSVGRIGGEWQLCVPTPMAANAPVELAPLGHVVLNEWDLGLCASTGGWLELANLDPVRPAALGGAYIGDLFQLDRMEDLSFLEPGGYGVIPLGPGRGAIEVDPVAGGGVWRLIDAAGLQIDSIAYAPCSGGQSEGRLPDGTGSPTWFTLSASPGAANHVVLYEGPILNEIAAKTRWATADTAGRFGDWVELYHSGSDEFDLSGHYLSDSPSDLRKWRVPDGVRLGPESYLWIACDGNRWGSTGAAGLLNSGFSLSGQGGGVYLSDPLGRVVQALEYGPQVRDRTIGRTPSGWTLLEFPTPGWVNAQPAALAPQDSLRLNEWMANPGVGEDWAELVNTDSLPVSMSELFWTDDPSLDAERWPIAPGLSFLGPGDWVSVELGGAIGFALNMLGDSLIMVDADGGVLDELYFGSQELGVSRGRLPDGGGGLVRMPGGTSGFANAIALTGVEFDECDPGIGGDSGGAIDLVNLSAEPIDISGWWVTTTLAAESGFVLPQGTVLGAGQRRTISQADWLAAGLSWGFGGPTVEELHLWRINGAGDWSGERATVSLEGLKSDRPMGRVEFASAIHWTALADSSHGTANGEPYVGPLVISEVMYHPYPNLEWGEYIEVTNRSEAALTFGPGGEGAPIWRLSGGIGFEFPAGLRLGAGASLVVVGFDPVERPDWRAAFVQQFTLPEGALLVGPFKGRLDNAGELVLLERQGGPIPDLVGGVGRPFLEEERVDYMPTWPWPVAADGLGAALERVSLSRVAFLPESWTASVPTPGWVPGLEPEEDSDGDGMPDAWELAHGLDPHDPSDAGWDGDRDGRSNLDEYRSGTDPWDPGRRMSGLAIEGTSDGFLLRFQGDPGATYSILVRDGGDWERLADVTASTSDGMVSYLDEDSQQRPWRFYRVVGPALP